MPKPQKQIALEARNMSDECFRMLCRGIVVRAAMDSQNPKYKTDVNDFLSNEWGQTVCSVVEIDATALKERLNKTKKVQILNTRVDHRRKTRRK